MACAFSSNQPFIQHYFEITLQATVVHIRTDTFKILNGEFTAWEQITKRLALMLFGIIFIPLYLG